MKNMLKMFLCCLISSVSYAQTNSTDIAVIPQPVSIVKTAGKFLLPNKIIVEAGPQSEIRQLLVFLKDRLSTPTGNTVVISNAAANATVRLVLNKTTDAALGKEGYQLSVTPKKCDNKSK